MVTRLIDALDSGGNVVATHTETDDTVFSWDATVIFPGLAAGDYTFVQRTPETGVYTVAAGIAPTAAGSIADQTFTKDTAITPLDVSADFSGTEPITYALAPSSAALPAGLSLSSVGEISGTPTTPAASVTIVVRGTNAYGSDDTAFGVTVTAAAAITIDTLTYTRGTAGVAPDLASTVSSPGTIMGPFTMFWATRSTGTALSKSSIENGTGEAMDNGSFTAATLDGLDGVIDLANSLSSGAFDSFIRDSSGTPVESDVAAAGDVTYDADAPVFVSAEIGTVDATSLIVTFDKALYGSTAAADWDVQVNGAAATESAASISGSMVDITLGAAVVNGDTVAVAYNGTGIVGVDAEVAATFTAQAVTNNVVAGVTNYYVDPDFTGTVGYSLTAGISVGAGLVANGTNPANSAASLKSREFFPLPSDTATYRFRMNVAALPKAGDRLRISPLCYDGMSANDTILGTPDPSRIGGSTVAINTTGVVDFGTFTVPAGTTHIKWVVVFIDANMEMTLDGAEITMEPV